MSFFLLYLEADGKSNRRFAREPNPSTKRMRPVLPDTRFVCWQVEMNFCSNFSKSGPYEFGYEQGWHWSKNKGSYDQGRDFFWVHWEISDDKPDSVKLHVESPNVTEDEQLNLLKQQMVQEFLSSHFKKAVEENGFSFVPGRQVSLELVKRNKSTQPFRVVLTPEQAQKTHRENIEMVNAAMSQSINEVVERFASQLDARFNS